MPPRQVYGKKKTHVFSTGTFLASPVKIKADASVAVLTSELSKLHLVSQTQLENSSRHALNSIDSNPRNKRGPHHADEDQNCKESNVQSATQPSVGLAIQRDTQKEPSQPIVLSACQNRYTTSQKPSLVERRGREDDIRTLDESGDQDTLLHLEPLFSLSTASITPFTDFDTALSAHFDISKIAEASFSQVFLLDLPARAQKKTSSRGPKPSVLKLIPLAPPSSQLPIKPSKSLSTLLSLSSNPSNVASEVRLLQNLSPVPGFTTFRALHLLRGRPGPTFSAACKKWNSTQRSNGKDTSHFPDPLRSTAYKDTQLWAVIEMQDAGVDLEKLIETPEWQVLGVDAVWDVFWQVVLACGKAETACRWEHRDLHLGNICVRLPPKSIPQSNGEDAAPRRRNVGFTGLEATIIDYTISRAGVPSTQGEEDIAYIDLDEDEALFEGDGELEYQYDIYRFMRAAVFLDDPLADLNARWAEIEESGRTWRGYHPQTNVVWLHFVLHELLSKSKHSVASGQDLEYSDYASILQDLRDILRLENWQQSGLRSAGDLVALALKRGWLDYDDVVGLIGEAGKKTTKLKRKVR